MSDLQRIFAVFLTTLLGGFLYYFLQKYVPAVLVTIFLALLLFFIGFLLNKSSRKKSKSVTAKVISIVLFLFLLFLELDVVQLSPLTNIMAIFGIQVSSILFYVLYICCGYLFVE